MDMWWQLLKRIRRRVGLLRRLALLVLLAVPRLGSSQGTSGDQIIDLGDLVIDRGLRSVTLEGKQLDLRPREFDLLAHLAANPGRVYTRDQLLQDVWGFEYAGDTRTVDVHVRWLRLKIEDNPAKPTKLSTVRGVGYRINV